MNIYMLLLRTVHVFGSVLWVGSAVLYLFFITPAVKSIGPTGQTFMQNFIGRQRYPMYMNMVSILTILSGGLLYWRISGGQISGWLRTGPGLGFTIGSVVGIAVFFVGFLMIKPRAEQIEKLGAQIGRSGGRPTPDQAAEMERLEGQILQVERLDFILLTIALLAMATARYWSF